MRGKTSVIFSTIRIYKKEVMGIQKIENPGIRSMLKKLKKNKYSLINISWFNS